MDYNDHHQDINNPFGFILSVCLLSISFVMKLIEINLTDIDKCVVYIIHFLQVVAVVTSIIVGVQTFRKNNRNKTI
jgi:hypothetical protein